MFAIIYKKSKPGVKGVFTRDEKINILEHKKHVNERAAFIREERAKMQKEVDKRKTVFASVKVQMANPDKKIGLDKKGNFVHIPGRIKGKFQKREALN